MHRSNGHTQASLAQRGLDVKTFAWQLLRLILWLPGKIGLGIWIASLWVEHQAHQRKF